MTGVVDEVSGGDAAQPRQLPPSIVIDDVLPPWQPRMIEVRGTATVVPSGGKAFGEHFEDTVVRIRPTRIISFGIDADQMSARSVDDAGR